jgi:ribosomal-protein-serine acetyltransferase
VRPSVRRSTQTPSQRTGGEGSGHDGEMQRRPAELIEIEHLILRRCGPPDLKVVHRLVEESLEHLRPWMGWAAVDGYSFDHTTAFIAECESGWIFGKAFHYLILVDGVAVGVAALGRTVGAGALELGYWLHPEHTGRGYATLASRALTSQAFTLEGIQRVEIWHDAANTASSAVPRKLGFRERERRSPPRQPLTSGEVGIDVVWELGRTTSW